MADKEKKKQTPNEQGQPQAPYSQGQDPYPQGQVPYYQGQPTYFQGQAPNPQDKQEAPYPQAQYPYFQAQPQTDYPQTAYPQEQAQTPYSQTKPQTSYPQGQQPYPQGQQPYPQGQQPYPQGQPPYYQGQPPYPQAQQEIPYPQMPYGTPYYQELPAEPVNEKIKKKAKSVGWTVYYVFGIIYNAFFSIMSGVLFAMTHIWTFALATLAFMTILISDVIRIKKGRYPKKFWRNLVSSGALLGLLIYMMMMPVSFKTKNRDDYDRYCRYTDMVIDNSAFFPLDYQVPMAVKDFKMVNKTKAYKKSNWTSLRFKMDPESEQWLEFLDRKNLTKDDLSFSLIDSYSAKTLSYYERKDYTINGQHFMCDEDFWFEHEKNTYVIYPSNRYFNSGLGSNESRVILINWDEGMIEFSQLVKK